MKKRLFAAVSALALIMAALFTACSSQEYPAKNINLVIPWSAGGTTDLVGRVFARQLEQHLGASVSVVNSPGGAGAIGTQAVFDAPADGYTVLLSAETPATFRVTGVSDLSFEDFEFIRLLTNDPKVIVVSADSPYDSLEDLVEDIRGRPGKVKMSHTGPGGSGYLQWLIYGKCGLDISEIQYDGGSGTLLAVLSGEVDFTNPNLSTVIEYVEEGGLKLLGVLSDTRSAHYPDIPAVTELLPEMGEWLPLPYPCAVLVKKGTPEDVVDALQEACGKAVLEEGWTEYVESMRLEDMSDVTGDAAAAFYSDWSRQISWMLYDAGVAARSPEDFGIERP